MQHDYATRTVTDRADQAQAQELLGNTNPSLHQMKANFIYDLPRLNTGGSTGAKIAGAILNDWQVSGIWTGISSTAYTITPSYTSGGGNLNLTGSPDYAARVLVTGDPGSGCSSDPIRQFNAAAFQGPAVGSVGLESGNNYLRGCFQQSLDLAVNKTIPLGRSRSVQFRIDIFNAPNFGDHHRPEYDDEHGQPEHADHDHEPAVRCGRQHHRLEIQAARRRVRRRHGLSDAAVDSADGAIQFLTSV